MEFRGKSGYTCEHYVEQTYRYYEMVSTLEMWVIFKH